MTTLLEIPLRDIKPSAIEELKNKYPGATLRIEAANALHSGQMDDDQFWAIIDLLDWKQADREAIVGPAIEVLSALPSADIRTFHELLHQKLYALDGKRFAVQLGSNRYAPDENKPSGTRLGPKDGAR